MSRLAALAIFATFAGCTADATLSPEQITVDEWDTVLEIGDLPPRALLHAERGRLSTHEFEVTVGDVPAQVVDVGPSWIRIRSSRRFVAGIYRVVVRSGGERYRANPDLQVVAAGLVDASIDAPIDALMTDAFVAADTSSSDASVDGVCATVYRDVDEDGFGDPASPFNGCETPGGFVLDDSDCDDSCPTCHPGFAWDICGDGADNDCNGTADDFCACELLEIDKVFYVVCPDARVSQSTAQAECQLLGGHLATPETRAEHDALTAGARDIEYWIDGTDEGHAGQWTWWDMTVYTTCERRRCECVGECAWRRGSPNKDNDNCMILGADEEWREKKCSDQKAYICELL